MYSDTILSDKKWRGNCYLSTFENDEDLITLHKTTLVWQAYMNESYLILFRLSDYMLSSVVYIYIYIYV